MEPQQHSREHYITFVANYLRKSRGENESDLDKHRLILTDICDKNNWKYVEYFEIETGDSIEVRPVFKRLLEDIEQGLYDAVACVDIDRLGRGSKSDQDLIENTFRKANTLIATPTKIYDLTNEDDEFVVDMKGFLARREYKMIVKRLSQGKKVGSRRGDWTNGTPPYPYEYERWNDDYNPKGIVVNKTKLDIYRYMIDGIIRFKMTPFEIAWELNKKRVLSPRGGLWHGNTVTRIIVDETHLGRIITNKTKGDGHKKKKKDVQKVITIPKDDWVVVENCHKAVKTQEEHDTIRQILHSRNLNINRSSRAKLSLSGLIKCGVCGRTMQVYRRRDRTYNELKPCWYKSPLGEKCINGGSILSPLMETINIEIDKYEEQLSAMKNENQDEDIIKFEKEIQIVINNIQIKEKALDKIHDAYENDVYSDTEFKKRKEKVSSEISALENSLEMLTIKLKNTESMTNEDRLLRIKNFREIRDDSTKTQEELNRAYKEILDHIVWKKTGDEVEISVNFL